MIYLLLSLVCSVSMALMLKSSEQAGQDSGVVIAANYVAGGLVGWLLIALDGGTSLSLTTLLLGIGGGLIWPLPFFILTRTIRELGVAIAAPLARFGLIIPVLFGVLFLGERLSMIGVIGLFGALVAIVLISPLQMDNVRGLNQQALWLIPVMIVMIGIASLWLNLFNTLGNSAETNLFFTLIYNFAALFCGLFIWQKKPTVTQPAVLRGSMIGLANFFYTYFLLGALRAPLFFERSAIVYTVVNVGYMMLVFAAGALIWREKVSRKSVVGVGVAAVALVLLNLR